MSAIDHEQIIVRSQSAATSVTAPPCHLRQHIFLYHVNIIYLYQPTRYPAPTRLMTAASPFILSLACIIRSI